MPKKVEGDIPSQRKRSAPRPVQFWPPDVDSPEFIAEAHRQSLAIANSPSEEEDQAFVDSVSVWYDEE